MAAQDRLQKDHLLDVRRRLPPSLLVALDGFGRDAEEMGHLSLGAPEFRAH